MATPTSRLKLKKQTLGSNLNQWGLSGGLNGVFDQVDVLAGYLEVNLGSATSYTFGTTNYATTGNEHMYRAVKFSGSPASGVTVNIPAVDDFKFVENATGQTITFSNGSTTATLANTFTGYIRTNGSSVITVLTLPDGVNVKTVADNIASVNQVATDSASVIAVAGKATEIQRLGTADAVADMALLGTTPNVNAMAELGTSANVTAQGHLGTAANVIAQGHLGTAANVIAQGHLGTSANVTAMGNLGTSANVTNMANLSPQAVRDDMSALGTSAVRADMAALAETDVLADMAALGDAAVITDLDLLGTTANVTAMGHLGTSGNVTAMGHLGTSANVTAQGHLGTSANVTAMGELGTSANVTAMGHLGTSANVTAMGNLGTTQNVTNMANLGTSQNVTNMNALSGISADITGVNAISGAVTAVNTDPLKSSINTTAGAIANVNNVGGSIGNVNAVAGNMGSVNSFANTYQISTNNPTTGGDGSSALANGMLAYVTSAQKLRAYNATSGAWEDAGSAVNGTSARFSYTATANQTTFPSSGSISYDANFADVYLNGVKLQNGTDVNVTSGTNVVLASGAAVGDIVDIVAYGSFNVANTYTQAQTNTLLAAKATTTDLATTNATVATKAPLASPNFTGTPQIGGVNIATTASIPAGGNSVELTATGSIAQGAQVILNSDGTTSSVAGTIGGGVGMSNFVEQTASTTYDYDSCYDTVNDQFFFVYQRASAVRCMFATLSGTTFTYGSEIIIASQTANAGSQIRCAYDSGVNKIIVVCRATNNSPHAYVVTPASGRTGTVSNTAYGWTSSSNINYPSVCHGGGYNWIHYTDYNQSNGWSGLAKATISGSGATASISFNDQGWVNTGATYYCDIAFDPNHSALLATYVDGGNSFRLTGRAIYYNSSTTNAQFGNEFSISAGGVGASFDTVFDATQNKMVVLYQQANNYPTSRNLTFSGTGTGISASAGAVTYISTAQTIDWMRGVYRADTGKVVAIYRQSGTLYGTQNTGIFVEGTSTSGTSSVVTWGSTFQEWTGGSSLYYAPVYDPDNQEVISFLRRYATSGSWAYALAAAILKPTTTNLTTSNWLGVASSAAADGQQATILLTGAVSPNQSGLTLNTEYYVDADGTLSTLNNAYNTKVGLALGTTKLKVE